MGISGFQKTDFNFRVFDDRDALTLTATDWIADAIKDRLVSGQPAKLALSGGSTPKPVYEALSEIDLDWSKVEMNLVDERLGVEGKGSNAAMVRDLFLKNKAAKSKFIAMTGMDLSPKELRYDICILGMGTDGHTASLFPGSKGLSEGLDPYGNKAAIHINAKGCPGAGIYPDRFTLTLPTLMNSRHILLLLTGEEKLSVFENAREKSVYEAPIKAVLASGSRLTVMWAP